MSWFTAPPAVTAPAVQRGIATVAHERIGAAMSFIQSGAVGINSGKPENILQLAQRLRTELGIISSSNVEQSILYKDASNQNRQEVGNRLKMIRAYLEGAKNKAENKRLLERGVTTEKSALIKDIQQDFIQVLYNLRALERLLLQSERQRVA